jgi:hypothetical protein
MMLNFIFYLALGPHPQRLPALALLAPLFRGTVPLSLRLRLRRHLSRRKTDIRDYSTSTL